MESVRGVVKWFNEKKGYGFITPSYGGQDVFMHYSSLDGKGFKTIQEGQAVSFQVIKGPKGEQAVNVIKIEA